MISILIPTYNYNVYPLTCELEKLAINAEIAFEIICFDDGSLSKINNENHKINTLLNSKFVAFDKNIGLSNNRNKLAKVSKYEYLLFIDGDSLITNQDYLKRYLEAITENTEVIYGGRVHPLSAEPSKRLRWKYGVYREDKAASKRIENKFKSILFNNTLIKKSLFMQIGFEKTIIQYGHEDTIFAYHLSKIKAQVTHINNPVLHGDIDLNEVYYNKTKKGIENLNFIYNSKLIDVNFVTLLKIFNRLKTFKLHYLFAHGYKFFSKLFEVNLTSNRPSLYLFDLFKLTYFCHINLKK